MVIVMGSISRIAEGKAKSSDQLQIGRQQRGGGAKQLFPKSDGSTTPVVTEVTVKN